MMTRPVEARRPGPPESGTGYSAPTVEPLAGVSSPGITAAARRVAQQIRDDGTHAPDMDLVAAELAALVLAGDQQRHAAGRRRPDPRPGRGRQSQRMNHRPP